MPFQRCEKFIQLRLNAKGLPGTFVQEHLGAYRCLDEMGAFNPRAITAIGGWLKRRFLATNMGIFSSEHDSIALTKVAGRCILFDCELHRLADSPVPSIRAGPIATNMRQHLMQCAPPRLRHLAYGLYCNILPFFSDVTLIFVPDFDDLHQVIELLCYWMQCCWPKNFPTCPRVLLLHEQRPPKGKVHSMLAASFLAQARRSDPTRSYCASAVNKMIEACFQLVDCTIDNGLLGLINSELTNSFLDRMNRGKAFKALHYKALLQSALKSYIDHPSRPFNLVVASRLHYPVPLRLEDSLTAYLGGQFASQECVKAVASALVLDAYPPQMHRFRPEEIFNVHYQEATARCGQRIGDPSLLQDARNFFIDLSVQVLHGEEPRQQHKEILRQTRPNITCGTPESCSFCIVEKAIYVLKCRHYFCESCVLRECTLSASPWHQTIETCPICEEQSSIPIATKPPTAGTRILEISERNVADQLKFIKLLSSYLELGSIPFRDYFDGAQGSGIGIFFIIAVFIEGWQLADCDYHSSRVQYPKFKRGIIDFSSDLSWHTQNQLSRCDMVVCREAKTLYASLSRASPKPNVKFSSEDLSDHKIANELLAALFYIELVSLPTFHCASSHPTISLRCRLPPGRGLLDLACKLYRGKFQLYCRAEESYYTKSPMCSLNTLRMIELGEPYDLKLYLKVISPESVIQIKMDGIDGKRYNISGCPYKLQDLIYDQGLDCHFGWRTYAQALAASQVFNKAVPDMEMLICQLSR